MSPIIALVAREQRDRILRCLGNQAHAMFCDTAGDLQALVAEHGAAVVITELRDRSGESTKPVIGTLHRRLPDVPIIVIGGHGDLSTDEILEVGTLGVTALLEHAAPNFGESLRAALEKSEEHSPAAAFARVAAPLVPEDVLQFFGVFGQAGVARATVEETMRGAGLAPRTVRDRLRRAGLPPPQRILSWSRLLHAMWRLELSGRPVKAIANELGYGSEVALRNQLKRYTGMRVSELRAAGGFAFLLSTFADELRRERPGTDATPAE